MRSLSGLLFLIIGIIIGCYVINIIKAFTSIRNLRIADIPTIRITEKKETSVAIALSNQSSSDIGMFKLVSPYGTLFKIGTVPCKSTLHVSPETTFSTRGVYKLSQLNLHSAYPFGFIECSKRLTLDGEFVVFPAIYDCPTPPAAGYEPMVGGAYASQHRTLSGNDFAGIRPMQPGDPVKYIHWKSSSKGRGLMVKEFNEELSGRISFILDNSPAVAENGEKALDWAARCAGSLIFSALDKGHHTELIDLNSFEILSIPPYSDGDMVLEALARTGEKEKCLNPQSLGKAVSMVSGKSSLCLILSRSDTEIGNYIRTLIEDRRSVSVYLPAGEAGKAEFPAAVSLNFFDKDCIRDV